ncbi:MAG: transglycosylase domain-containing protein [Actinomycetota bacterium]
MAFPRRWLVFGVSLLMATASACSLPSLNEERAQAPTLPQTSFLYAADGSLITRLHAGEDRIMVPSSKIPQVVRNAVVAVEDKRFYEHRGIDLKAVLRAAYIDATRGEIVEGGSTITQQYVKLAFVGDEQTLSRKIKEAFLAWQLEKKLTKDQILTRYLNTVYFGNGAYGIQAAAETYFDRPAAGLTLAQAALLAGLIRAPNDFDPVSHPKKAISRRNRVLLQMLQEGMIRNSAYLRATERSVNLRRHVDHDKQYIAPYFVDYFKRWFLSNPRFGRNVHERYDLLFKGGLRITTTLVPTLQLDAENAVNSILIYHTDPYAAMTVIDPRTGFVKAMVGGRDYWSPTDRFARVNLATGGTTGRQAGSAFKPFALVAALENGLSPQTPLNASYASISLQDGTWWTPLNYDGSGYGTISLEAATIDSVNIAYANLVVALGDGDAYEGAAKVVRTARRMGIRCCSRTSNPDRPLKALPSAVLGTNEVNTLEMASAYGTLAMAGFYAQPTPVVRITKPNGDILFEASPRPRQVMNPAVASVARSILEKVVLYGTGTAANIGRPQIGKTGTAQDWHDAWFVGAIPQLVAAVWVGFPQGQVSMTYPTVRISHVLGGTWPAQIWRAFMVNATQNIPARPFPTSEVQYVRLRIDTTQGCLANQYTLPQDIEIREFIAGTEPRLSVCTEPTSYQYLTVPSAMGLPEDEALSLLRSSGFDVQVLHQQSDLPEGTVIAQDPGPGEQALQATTVTITVAGRPQPSAGLTVIPAVVGMTQGQAEATLRSAGFETEVVQQEECDPESPSCVYRKGYVWAQLPDAGTRVQAGSEIRIYVNP